MPHHNNTEILFDILLSIGYNIGLIVVGLAMSSREFVLYDYA